MNNFYDFIAEDSNGQNIKMSDYRGQVVLVVNTASNCGFTKQYAGLEKIYQDYKNQDFIILAFPCNQFAGQEPKDGADIVSFCQLNYGVSFPIFKKIKVNGRDAHPLFTYLKQELSGILGGRIKWNFTKFLIDRSGQPLKRFASAETPEEIDKYLIKNKILDKVK
ncbi:MAG: glutathione peroxidase [Patescibacteria group bacterium]|nr:glutathione peroxidase [Patescibacteria group bacterium]